MGKFIKLPNYPTAAWGATQVNRGDFFGSNNYQQGGEVQVPGTYGFQGIEAIQFDGTAYSVSNNYFARVSYPANSFNSAEQLAPAFGQTASAANNTNAPVIKWFIASNNAEVANNTNLAAEVVRATFWGV